MVLGRALWMWVFVSAVALPGSSVDDALSRAERLISTERLPEAEDVLTSAKHQHPQNVELIYQLGYVLFRQRKLSLAAAEFHTVIKLAPQSMPSRYFLGRIALLQNEPQKAIRWLEPIATATPPVYDAAAHLARAYADTDQPKRALQTLRIALAQTPWDGALYYRLGRAYDGVGEKALAKEAFATSGRLNRANRDLVEKLMRCSEALRTGDRNSALAIRDELMTTTEDPDALVALGSTLAGGSLHADAATVFERAVEKGPSLFQAQYNLGLSRLKLNDLERAIAPLVEAVRLLPRSAEANAALGTVYFMSGRHAEAVEALERAHTADPSMRQVPGVLAVAYLRTQQTKKAAELLRATVKQFPDEPRLWFLLVEVLNRIEDPEGALATARAAQQRFADNPQANLALGQQLARSGQYAEAGTFFERVVASEPANPNALLGLAESLEKKGEAARALELYRRAAPAAGVIARLGAARSLVLLRQLPEARLTLEEAAQSEPQNQQVRIELARVYARLGMKDQSAEQNRILQDLRRAQP